MAQHHEIDATAWSVVVRCIRPGCLWRAQVHDRRAAWRLLAEHSSRVHRDRKAASQAWTQAQRAAQIG